MEDIGEEKPTRPTMMKKLAKFFKRQPSENILIVPNTSFSPKMATHTNRLFGRPLTEVCEPDNSHLPHQLMDLLTYLYDYGPITTEIFRKSASTKKCEALVDKIENDDSSWKEDESLNALLLAAVFKRYLRELPDKLLSDKRYNEWASIIENSSLSQEQLILSIKRMVESLPSQNQMLLRYVICLLRRIHENSAVNLMTAYNLSVCVGPCLLWTTSPDQLHLTQASKAVPKLLEFMLINYIDIFGSEVKNLMLHQLKRNTSKSLDSVLTSETGEFLAAMLKPEALSLPSLDCSVRSARLKASLSSLSKDSGLVIDERFEEDKDLLKQYSRITGGEQSNMVSLDSLDCDFDNIATTFTKEKADKSNPSQSTALCKDSSTVNEHSDRENRPTKNRASLVRLISLPYTVISKDETEDTGHTEKYTTTIELPVVLVDLNNDLHNSNYSEGKNKLKLSKTNFILPKSEETLNWHRKSLSELYIPPTLTRLESTKKLKARTYYYV